MPVSKSLRALVGFSRLPDWEVLVRGRRIYDCMSGNKAFRKPPVDLQDFKKQLDDFEAAIGMAVHRDKRAIALRHQKRLKVCRTIRILGHYVEEICPHDRATFISSGFEHGPTAHIGPQSLPQPLIVSIEQGNKGQLLVRLKPVGRDARHYELRVAQMDGDAPAGEWKVHQCTNARIQIPFNGLVLGATYSFQVRAYGRLGHTDWSDSRTRMCI